MIWSNGLRQMNAAEQRPLFEFESSDSIAQFAVWFTPLSGGGIIALIAWDQAGGWALASIVLTCLILVLGLRSSIAVFPDRVQIVRKWFFLPYRIYRAPAIESVWFGGDWGLDDDAMGIVVEWEGRRRTSGPPRTCIICMKRLLRSPGAGTRTRTKTRPEEGALEPRSGPWASFMPP